MTSTPTISSHPMSADSPLADLKKGDIRRICGDRFYARGRRYFEQGRVEEVRLELGEEETEVGIVGTVRGSGRNRYRQVIHLERYEDEVEFMGRCSCPVTYNCKHVAAVLLAAREAGDGALVRGRLEEWLARLHELKMARTGLGTPPGEQALLYRLHLEREQGSPALPQLRVTLHLARRRKKGHGGFTKGRLTRLYSHLGYYRPDYMQPLDTRIASLLEQCQTGNAGLGYRHAYDASAVVLTGPAGAQALALMLRSGRCYWGEETRQPLRPAEPRRLLLRWEREGGLLRLAWSLEPAGGELVAMDSPVYVDPAGGGCGPVEWEGDGELLAALLEAPPVPAPSAREVTQRLLGELAELPLPTPTGEPVVEIPGRSPQPCLRLCLDPERGRVALLRFEYDGHLPPVIPIQQCSVIEQEGKFLRIHRDLAAEKARVDRLLEAGLQYLDETGPETDALAFTRSAEGGPGDWLDFLSGELPALEHEGWRVELEQGFAPTLLEPEQWELSLEEGEAGWFDLSLGVQVGERRIDLVPLLGPLLRDCEEPERLPERELLLPLGEGEWLRLPGEALRPVVETLFELFDRQQEGDEARLRLSRVEALRLEGLEQALDRPLHWQGGEGLRQMARRLCRRDGAGEMEPPPGFGATLRPYQRQGLAWLQLLRETGFGGVLADDMGLGKTVQTLAHLLTEKAAGRLDRPALVVAPTSLMGNWRSEARQFAPELSVLVLQGPQRRLHFGAIGEHDLVLTTYPLLPRDGELLAEHEYHMVILDEAQIIKNPRTQAARVVRALRCRHRLALTGTPMENHLGELWSLFDYLEPGLLGAQEQFARLFRTPIEKRGDQERALALRRRLAPFILRRTKEEVAAELPPKSEIVRSIRLEGRQADLYESIRLAMDRKVRQALASKGLARSRITILEALLKLRQVCCDPRLVKLQRAKGVRESAKLELLMALLPELIEEGRRVLLFSQFTTMLGLIEEQLRDRGIPYSKLTGRTRKREEAIGRFRRGEVPLFLISLKAGGLGLNLTEADTVIHYDPWWNPAAEAQATDRAHRIGQDKPVFVYKLLTEGTVEERILALQRRKAELAEQVYRGRGQGEAALTEADLEILLRPLGNL